MDAYHGGVSGTIEPSGIRASDAERAVITERLNQALGEGRLDLTEYDRRVSAAYRATTRADLAPLVADLPEPQAAAPVAARPQKPSLTTKEWRDEVRAWAGVSIILVAIWVVSSVASGDLTFFWPMFPMGIWGAVLISKLISPRPEPKPDKSTKDRSKREKPKKDKRAREEPRELED